MMMLLDDQAFLNGQRQHAALRIDLDVFDVGRNLTAVADALVIVIDLQDVLAKRIGVEYLTDRKIHERQERVAGNLLVSDEADLCKDRILDDAISDRYAVRPLAHQRRRDVGEVAERVDSGKVVLDDLRVVGLAGPRPDDRHDDLRRHAKVARDVNGDDLR